MAANDVFEVGQDATITLTVKNDQGQPVDPGTLDWTPTLPDGTPGTTFHLADFTRLSLGTFRYDFPTTQVGFYPWHAVTTSPDTVGDGGFEVVASPESVGDLITPTHYARITGDSDTAWPAVSLALSEALGLAEGECKRTFGYGTRTETLDVYSNGVVYPSVTPVASVADPTGTQLRYGGVYLGAFWPNDLITGLPSQRTLTYSGGYHPFGSGHAPELPVRLTRALCRIAFLMLHPASMVAAGVPAGAKSASVGDVSVAGDLSGFIAVDASIGKDLARFKRRRPALPFVRV